MSLFDPLRLSDLVSIFIFINDNFYTENACIIFQILLWPRWTSVILSDASSSVNRYDSGDEVFKQKRRQQHRTQWAILCDRFQANAFVTILQSQRRIMPRTRYRSSNRNGTCDSHHSIYRVTHEGRENSFSNHMRANSICQPMSWV